MPRDSRPTTRPLAPGSCELPALSISRSVCEYLQVPRAGAVLATFRRSCYLDLDGRIVALVAAELLNGPLNIVLEAPAEHSFQTLRVGGVVASTTAGVTIDATLHITFVTAQRWTAALAPWTRITEGPLAANLALARIVLLREAPKGSVAHVLPSTDPARATDFDGVLRSKARHALAALAGGLRRRDHVALAEGARQLAGFGSGLTPSGDDVLVGTLLALAISPPADAITLRTTLMAAAAGRSTRISEAYLEASARGEASEPWHRLLAVLPGGHSSALTTAARALIAVGETSGADMLAGFLLAQEAMGP